MKTTGLKKFENTTVENFTSEIGIKVRILINKPWRSLLKFFIKREVIIEDYPKLDPKKSYIFACNHSFDEDVISLIHAIDRNVYVLNGTTDQTEHNPQFIAMWANGMIYVNRDNKESRSSSIKKMERIINSGSNVMIFPEGSYNNSENLLIMKLFPGICKVAKKTGAEIVPMISFNEPGSNKIYIRGGEPINVQNFDIYEGCDIVRDRMATILYHIIEEHTKRADKSEFGPDPRQYWMDLRKSVYECQKWYSANWAEEEVKQYKGHNVVTADEVFKALEGVEITKANAHLVLPVLIEREKEKKYDLIDYLTKTVPLHSTQSKIKKRK